MVGAAPCGSEASLELLFALVVLAVAAAVVVAVLRLVGAILMSRFFWGTILVGCLFVGANGGSDVVPWCVGIGVVALIALRGASRRSYDPGPTPPPMPRNYPMQVDQINGWGLYRKQ